MAQLCRHCTLTRPFNVDTADQAVHTHTPAAEPRRSGRTNKGVPLVRLIEFCDSTQLQPTKAAAELATPELFSEAIASPDAKQWVEAMRLEHQALLANRTYTLVPLPQGHVAVRTRWLYKIKSCADGTIERYKAQWVAKGYSQRHGVDYDKTFAPMVHLKNLHMLLAYTTL